MFTTLYRPGSADSQGSKHRTRAAAVLDVLDNTREHGATHIVVSAGVATPLQVCLGRNCGGRSGLRCPRELSASVSLARSRLTAFNSLQGFWATFSDDASGLSPVEVKGLVAHGGARRATGDKLVSFFNTGHAAACLKLGSDFIVATAKGGQFTLLR